MTLYKFGLFRSGPAEGTEKASAPLPAENARRKLWTFGKVIHNPAAETPLSTPPHPR